MLAHTDSPVVPDDIVFDALQTELDRDVAFVAAVDGYLDPGVE